MTAAAPQGGRAALAATFLRLGLTAFGGPAAHIALMEQEFVRRRGWLTSAEFLDLVGAASIIPGPSSTEVAIYIGYRRGGLRGLALAGSCFILPAALLVSGIAWAYVAFGRLPTASGASSRWSSRSSPRRSGPSAAPRSSRASSSATASTPPGSSPAARCSGSRSLRDEPPPGP